MAHRTDSRPPSKCILILMAYISPGRLGVGREVLYPSICTHDDALSVQKLHKQCQPEYTRSTHPSWADG